MCSTSSLVVAVADWNFTEKSFEGCLLDRRVEQVQNPDNGSQATKEAGHAWNDLMASVEAERLAYGKKVPCGLTQGESDPPIILHYNVRLHGDKITESPVIVQNTWTAAHDWGEEERCPSPDPKKIKKVDELEQCNKMVGKDDNRVLAVGTHSNDSRKFVSDGSKTKTYFPFKQGYLSVATLRVGTEGIQMTVDGKHITSFTVREVISLSLIDCHLEFGAMVVSEVRISGDIKLISVVASGLPTSEDTDHIIDLDALISPPLPYRKPLDLFVGVFSTANNFKRRMAVRRTWMQYPAVRSGAVVVRFFVGLHRNQMVNDELWNEAQTYHDIQLMPLIKVTHGLLYGLINSDSKPHRNPDSKWYITNEMFKLEDVAMGMWIADAQKGGMEVRYEKDERIFNEGCKNGYVVAHYQGPREMLCLWQKLKEGKRAICCGE
ncbi:hypothetical protein C3L33_13589, partial [Rhododendron williamsianum]